MEQQTGTALDEFIEQWPSSPDNNRKAFIELRQHLDGLEGVHLEFIVRPGITYSLRATHHAQKSRGLFVMIDVIEDAPRWLSVCFYEEMISDPEEKGDHVPGGLLGEDAVCFDCESYSEQQISYLDHRIDEAWQSARQG